MLDKKEIVSTIRQKAENYKRHIELKLLQSPVARKYSVYSPEDFQISLKAIGICPGDSVFVMCSQNKIYYETGKMIPVQTLLNDLINYLGEEGTVMALCFSINRDAITLREAVFDTRKTPTECGIFAESLRRKKGSVRSIHPIFSAISYGTKALEFSSSHHLSAYPFGEFSPYYKLMKENGKYLGIGVGFEAFTPCHMIEDYYKHQFKHRIYFDQPEKFSVITPTGKLQEITSYIRDPATVPVDYDPLYYFKLLNVCNTYTTTTSGIRLFTFNMREFFEAAIDIYDRKKITVWDTGSLMFLVRRTVKKLMRRLVY